MIKDKLTQATRLAQEGQIVQSIQVLQEQAALVPQNYTIISNLAALHLQLGDLSSCLQLCSQAIALDPYSHPSYYNKFLCLLAPTTKRTARKELHKALSCLYLLRGFEDKNLKYLNKAIFYCQQNAKAYLFRAQLNEGKNNKLAENDYSAAIEYDPNLADIYQQRALFYRRLGRKQEFQDDLRSYLRLKGQRSSINELTDNETIDEEQEDNLIKEEVKQFEELLFKRNPFSKSIEQPGISKLPLSSIQSNIDKKDEEQMLLSDRPEPESTQTITIKKEEIQFRKKNKEEKNFRQIFEDQSSGELNEQINQLEREIEKQGGKISLDNAVNNDELDISDPDNFLTQAIQSTITEITKLSSPENLAQIRSAKSAGSQGSIGNSKIGQFKQLEEAQFNRYNSIGVQIVSLEDLHNFKRKDHAKVVLKYGERKCETEMNKFEWREQFTFGLTAGMTELEVEVIEKGGIFRADFALGQGTINLLQNFNVKCIIGNKEKKVAILYYKITLS